MAVAGGWGATPKRVGLLALLVCAHLACGSRGSGSNGDAHPGDADVGDAPIDMPTDAASATDGNAQDTALEGPIDAAGSDVMDAPQDAAGNQDATNATDATDDLAGSDAAPDAPHDAGADAPQTTDAGGAGDAAPPDAGIVPTFSGLTLLAGLPGGPGRADGTSTTARFNYPTALYADGAGNLFVTDSMNHTVRKIAIATGTVSTLAGLPGTFGTTDGSGAAARFSYPRGVTGDGAGHLFVVDGSNCTIRRIDVAIGAVTSFAGSPGVCRTVDGTGTAATFNGPRAIAYDGAGHLLVAEVYVIRKIDVATGAVTTLAGGGQGGMDGIGTAAQFESPQALACDGAGNVFVADNQMIRKLVLATAEVTTLAGADRLAGNIDATGSAARFYNPLGLTYDGVGNLYIADSSNYAVRKLALATGVVSTIAVDPSGLFNPYAVVPDGAGGLFVVSYNSHSIRKVTIATGAITLFAGVLEHAGSSDATGTAARFYVPRGLVDDGAGNLFVADAGNATVRKIVVATGAVSTLAGTAGMTGSTNATGAAARFHYPINIVSSGAGDLYLTDTENSAVRKLTLTTGAVTTLSVLDPYVSGLAGDGATTLFVSNEVFHTVSKVSAISGIATLLAGVSRGTGATDATGTGARFNQPSGLAYDGAGTLFVADRVNHTIRRIVVATGAVTTLAGSAGMPGSVDGMGAAARFRFPLALAYDGGGGLFVADAGNHTIRRVVVATGVVTTVIGDPNRAEVVLGPLPAGLTAPGGLAFGAGGALYITDENSVLVAR